jgi:hypothetical protein
MPAPKKYLQNSNWKKREHVEVFAFLVSCFFQVLLMVRDQRQEAYKPVAAAKKQRLLDI